ncbi:MAG: ATP-binding protein [Acidobacteria bacterium]|nr:ATP-binding protein [Acidobacteriota bacterium]
MIGLRTVLCGYLQLVVLTSVHAQPRPWRIASNQSVPLNFWTPDGRPTGFASEVIQAAANRANIPLQWVRFDGLPEDAFERNQADLWPLAAALKGRRSKMHFSRPWWQSERALLTLRGQGVNSVAELHGRRVMLTGLVPVDTDSRLHAAARTIDSRPTAPESVASICNGQSDVVVIDYRLLQQVLLDRPKVCLETRLEYVVDPTVSQQYGVASSFGAALVADRLYAEIERMMIDGSFQPIARRWSMVTAIDPPMTAEIQSTRHSNTWLTWALTAALAASVVFAVLMVILWRARRSTEQAFAMRSRFLANMSHELRTPLGGILGMSELALETPLNAQQREYVSLAKSSAEHLLVLLNDILDFSKIEAGKMALEQVPFELEQAVAVVARASAVEAYRKGIRYRAWVDPQLPPVILGDPVRFRQILNNLTSNAVKFTTEGEVRVDVSQVERADREGTLRIAVTDSGIGIPPDKQQHIFNAFAQADGLVARQFGGTGLGLAITRELVRVMGGTIQVDSEAGRGSRFIIDAPFAVPEQVSAIPPSPAAGLTFEIAVPNLEEYARMVELSETSGGRCVSQNADILIVPGDEVVASSLPSLGTIVIIDPVTASVEETPGRVMVSRPVFRHTLGAAIDRLKKGTATPPPEALPVSRSLRLLAAEDDPVNQKLIQRLLESAGHSATVVGNGLQALEALARNQYDVVLMDVQMPEMDGLEAVARLREQERDHPGAHLPVVGLTAMAMKGDRDICLKAGMDECLTKPIHKKHLLEVLDRVTAVDASRRTP